MDWHEFRRMIRHWRRSGNVGCTLLFLFAVAVVIVYVVLIVTGRSALE